MVINILVCTVYVSAPVFTAKTSPRVVRISQEQTAG